MATYGQRAQAIADALIDGTATQQQLQRVAIRFAREFPHLFNPVDPANPTNAEYAACFVLAMRQMARRVLRSAAQDQAIEDNIPAVQTAGSDAESDL